VDPLAVAAVEYGTVPDWIAGIGTAFATIVAALAVNRECSAASSAGTRYRRSRTSFGCSSAAWR
jgi:hypothetical protein